MAPKGKKSSSGKKASGTISGMPDFPQQLLHWRMRRNISWGGCGVTKSWKLASRRCNGNGNGLPQLQLSCDIREMFLQVQESGRFHQPHYYNYFLKIPFLPSGFYKSASKLLVSTLCGPCSECWANPCYFSDHVYITDPYDPEQQHIIFTNAIGFQGKFYALSLHGALAVVEEVDSRFTITGTGKNRAVPSVPSRRFTEYLIQSNGEVLLVFLTSRKSISVIDYVEVVKLDLITLSWVKMDNLGDRALFLPGTGHGISVNANQVVCKNNQVSCKSNHVYFTHQGINCWKEFDMGSRNIVSSCCNF